MSRTTSRKTKKSSLFQKKKSLSEIQEETKSVEEIFLDEIKKAKKRDDLVDFYSQLIIMGIQKKEQLDWGKMNKAVVARWSFNALEYIKKLAWKKVEDAKSEMGN